MMDVVPIIMFDSINIDSIWINCTLDILCFVYNMLGSCQGYGNNVLEDIAVSELYYIDYISKI